MIDNLYNRTQIRSNEYSCIIISQERGPQGAIGIDTSGGDGGDDSDNTSAGKGLLMFDNMAALKENGTKGLDVKSEFKLLGYYQPYDGGGANYVCKYLWSQSAYPWAVDLGATDEIEYDMNFYIILTVRRR